MHRFLFAALFGVLLSGGAVGLLVWIWLPPPRPLFWVTGLIAGEWSLWLGLAGLAGAAIGAGVLWKGQTPGRGIVGMCIAAVGGGIIAAGLSLLPLFSTLPVAKQNGVVLSLSRYFAHPPRREAGTPDAAEAYATLGGQTLRLDIYRPPASISMPPGGFPAVVVVHGGSWKGGTRSDFPEWNRMLARAGFAVFDCDYRLEPAPNWREAASDVQAAVAWVQINATRLHVNPRRVALLGRSAGGHLALLAAYRQNPRVRAVVSLYGPADLVWGYHNPACPDPINGPETLRRFLGGSPETAPDAYALAAPIGLVNAHTPPTLLLHGKRDTLVGASHATRLAVRLENSHIPHQVVLFPDATHGFDYNRDGWASQVVESVLLAFLREWTR